MKVKQKSKNYVLYLLSRRSQRVTHVVYKLVSYHFVTQLQTEKLRVQEKFPRNFNKKYDEKILQYGPN